MNMLRKIMRKLQLNRSCRFSILKKLGPSILSHASCDILDVKFYFEKNFERIIGHPNTFNLKYPEMVLTDASINQLLDEKIKKKNAEYAAELEKLEEMLQKLSVEENFTLKQVYLVAPYLCSKYIEYVKDFIANYSMNNNNSKEKKSSCEDDFHEVVFESLNLMNEVRKGRKRRSN